MTYEEIIQNLQQKIYHPVYFLTGDEPYYIDKITEYITENVLSEAEKSFNQTVLYGKDSNAVHITETSKRFPMMASHQVVIVKEAQELDDFENLVHYVSQPLNSTLLVLNYKYKSLDKRKKIFKELQSNSVLFESKKLYENQIPGWITGYLSKKKYNIEPKAASLLTEFLGTDLSKITNELDKLIITLGPEQKSITPDHIERNIGISKDYNQFELHKALGKGDVVKANRIIGYFSQNQKTHHITATIASLYFYFSRLLLCHYISDRSKEGIAKYFKISPFIARDYVEAANRYSPQKVIRIISYLREYDLRSKGYNGETTEAGELLKELIFKIMH